MKKYSYIVGLIFCCYVVITCSQKFVKGPKEKKVNFSYQQFLELAGDIITSTNHFWRSSGDLLKNVSLVQQISLDTINAHLEGEKDCFLQQADKVERTDKYVKLLKIKNEVDQCNEDIEAMNQRLELLMIDFNKQAISISD